MKLVLLKINNKTTKNYINKRMYIEYYPNRMNICLPNCTRKLYWHGLAGPLRFVFGPDPYSPLSSLSEPVERANNYSLDFNALCLWLVHDPRPINSPVTVLRRLVFFRLFAAEDAVAAALDSHSDAFFERRRFRVSANDWSTVQEK